MVKMRTNLVVSDFMLSAQIGSSFNSLVLNSHLQISHELMHMRQVMKQVCVLQLHLVHVRLCVWGLPVAPDPFISLPGHC